MIRILVGCFVVLAAVLSTSCGMEPNAGAIRQGPLPEMDFAWIPSGTFSMGSPTTEPGRLADEGPEHVVTIQGFELMRTEVTQAMWQQVMGNNPATGAGEGPTWPIYSVSWTECHTFLDKLNELDPSHIYRLPTEAEWEYACRAGSITPYSWGATVEPACCWYSANSGSVTQPVGKKTANAWGLFDMSGNVAEWCEDWYHSDYTGAPLDGSAWVSPEGTRRVLRGGSFSDTEMSIRSACRMDFDPDRGFSNMGFRVARTAR